MGTERHWQTGEHLLPGEPEELSPALATNTEVCSTAKATSFVRDPTDQAEV